MARNNKDIAMILDAPLDLPNVQDIIGTSSQKDSSPTIAEAQALALNLPPALPPVQGMGMMAKPKSYVELDSVEEENFCRMYGLQVMFSRNGSVEVCGLFKNGKEVAKNWGYDKNRALKNAVSALKQKILESQKADTVIPPPPPPAVPAVTLSQANGNSIESMVQAAVLKALGVTQQEPAPLPVMPQPEPLPRPEVQSIQDMGYRPMESRPMIPDKSPYMAGIENSLVEGIRALIQVEILQALKNFRLVNDY
jgi:hypothetical protein